VVRRFVPLLVLAGCAPVRAPASVTPKVLTVGTERAPVTVTAEAWEAPAPAVDGRGEASPVVRAPPIVLPEIAESVPHQPAPRYAKLFERYKRYHYIVVDDIDPHAEDGGHIVTKAKVACDVIEVRSYEGALGVELDCTGLDAPDHGDSGIASSFVFVSAPGGLWKPPFLPMDQNDVGTVIFDPPMLSEAPEPRSRKVERPGATQGEIETCSQRVFVSPQTTCFEERCAVRDRYGDTRSHLCISQRGVESFTTENIGGLRKVRWQLQRVEPLPAPSCAG
jgi:hypothetical protein